LNGQCRRDGTTVFLDAATLEPHDDQWAYLSTLGRLSPREVSRLAQQLGKPCVGSAVNRLAAATSTKIRVEPAPVITATLGAAVTLNGSELTPVLMATLKHAASMANPEFYGRPGGACGGAGWARRDVFRWHCLQLDDERRNRTMRK